MGCCIIQQPAIFFTGVSMKLLSLIIIFLLSNTIITLSQKGSADTLSTRKATMGHAQSKAYNPQYDNESMSGNVEWQLVLQDDNGNIELPARYRTWWYIKLEGINKNSISKLHIIGDGFQGKSVVLPVYSYDRKTWTRLKPEDITNDEESGGFFNYTIEKKFDTSTVWIARYYPYSFAKLDNFIKSHLGNPLLKFEIIGITTLGKDIPFLTITDPSIHDSLKKRIWIHARTHASESASSYVLEGLIDFLLSPCNRECNKVDLKKLIFNIVPMVNIDGVMAGNARVSPDSSFDFERLWKRTDESNFDLRDDVPTEVKAMHSKISSGPDFIMALNLHSKNAYPNWRNFFYTNFYSNFKKENKKYGPQGDSIFYKTLSFANLLTREHCGDTIVVRASEEIERDMDKKFFPESWWWLNFRDSVLALTLEATTGRQGCLDEWTSYKDHVMLGEALSISIQSYYNIFIEKKWFRYNAPEADTQELLKFFIGNSNGR
jgi:hypothetical protein